MNRIDRSPALVSSGIAVIAGLAALTVGLYSGLAMAVGAIGFLVLLLGVVGGFQRAVTLGAIGLVAGAFAAGASGAPAAVALVSVIAAILSWDAGGTAIVLGRQLGREADTARVEAVHLGATTLVGLLVAGVGYGLFRAATGGKPLTALVLLLLAAVLLSSALR